MAKKIMCSECEEPAQVKPPTTWDSRWGPRPNVSHLDGEPLCPVVGDNGYEPGPAVPAGGGR